MRKCGTYSRSCRNASIGDVYSTSCTGAAFPRPSPLGRTRRPSGPTDVSPASMTSNTGPPRRSFGTSRTQPDRPLCHNTNFDGVYPVPPGSRSSRAQPPAVDQRAARRRIGLMYRTPCHGPAPVPVASPDPARPATDFWRGTSCAVQNQHNLRAFPPRAPHVSASPVDIDTPRTATACPVYAPRARDSTVRAVRSSVGHPERHLPKVQGLATFDDKQFSPEFFLPLGTPLSLFTWLQPHHPGPGCSVRVLHGLQASRLSRRRRAPT